MQDVKSDTGFITFDLFWTSLVHQSVRRNCLIYGWLNVKTGVPPGFTPVLVIFVNFVSDIYRAYEITLDKLNSLEILITHYLLRSEVKISITFVCGG